MVAANVLEQHLAQAERHVLQGETILERQHRLIEEHECGGHDTEAARKLLAQLEELQRLHLADRDRLRRELAGMRAS